MRDPKDRRYTDTNSRLKGKKGPPDETPDKAPGEATKRPTRLVPRRLSAYGRLLIAYARWLSAYAPMPPRRYFETDRLASEASGWSEGSPLGIAAAPASFFFKTGKLGYHRDVS